MHRTNFLLVASKLSLSVSPFLVIKIIYIWATINKQDFLRAKLALHKNYIVLNSWHFFSFLLSGQRHDWWLLFCKNLNSDPVSKKIVFLVQLGISGILVHSATKWELTLKFMKMNYVGC